METTERSQSGNGNRKRRGLAQRMKDDGKAKVESGKQSAAQQLDQIADAIDAAGVQLDQDQPTIASYANRLASGAGSLANRLRDRSIEDLGRDVRATATRNPALFLIGGVAIGAILARVMRVSDRRSDSNTTASGEHPADARGEASTDSASSGSAATGDEPTVDVYSSTSDASARSTTSGSASGSSPATPRVDV